MKFKLRKNVLVNLLMLFIGIVIGLQIPGLISDYTIRRKEQQVLKQINAFPNDSNNWFVVSQYRWMRGDRAGSFEAAQKALEVDPDNILAIEKIAYNFIEMGDVDQGKIWLEKALTVAAVHAPARTEMIRMTLSQLDKTNP